MRNIDDLHPKLQSLVYALQEECEKQGLKIKIGECFRTVEEQNALYAQGRTAPGSIVTKAKGSSYSSMHQWGVAFDFFRNDGTGLYNDKDGFFTKVGRIGMSLGLEWGGNWKSSADKPHFQLPDWGSTATKLKKLYGTPKKFMASWPKKEDLPMTQAEKEYVKSLENKILTLEKKVDELASLQEVVYHYTVDVPAWGRPTVQKLLDKGLYFGKSESDLDLPHDLMRQFVINDRAGMYDK